MPIHFTIDQAAERIAYQMLPEGLDDAAKARVMPAKKYNVLVNAFNASTVLLGTAILCAVVFAYAAAVAFGAIALFTRFASEKGLNEYTLPLAQRATWNVRQFFGHMSQDEKEDHIFARVLSIKPANWVENEVYLFDYAIWRNKVPVPEVVRA